MKENITTKEKGFIYKGNFYMWDSDLTVRETHFFVNTNSGEEYDYSCDLPWDKISNDTLLKVKVKYVVLKGYTRLESFDTKEEAKEFIELVSNSKNEI